MKTVLISGFLLATANVGAGTAWGLAATCDPTNASGGVKEAFRQNCILDGKLGAVQADLIARIAALAADLQATKEDVRTQAFRIIVVEQVNNAQDQQLADLLAKTNKHASDLAILSQDVTFTRSEIIALKVELAALQRQFQELANRPPGTGQFPTELFGMTRIVFNCPSNANLQLGGAEKSITCATPPTQETPPDAERPPPGTASCPPSGTGAAGAIITCTAADGATLAFVWDSAQNKWVQQIIATPLPGAIAGCALRTGATILTCRDGRPCTADSQCGF